MIKKEQKLGMYGEMPKIKIGKYTIADMSNNENCSAVWIEDEKTGEGGQFNKDTLLYFIDQFYRRNF
jgi:hypothetical protein